MKLPGAALIVLVVAHVAGCNTTPLADTDTDTDTDVDTDTSWDGGPMTPCEDEPPPGSDMVCVPGGTYLMGCMPYDQDCADNEKPMVEVTLSPFWIEKYEATYADVLVWLNGFGGPKENPGIVKYDNEVGCPASVLWRATRVDIGMGPDGNYAYGYGPEGACLGFHQYYAAGGFAWLGAVKYCESKGMRLPTEAEWEAAARGQTKWIYPCAWEHASCWYGSYAMCGLNNTYPNGECFADMADCCAPMLASTTGDCPSQCGARQMYGNAREWVLDHGMPQAPAPSENHSWCSQGCSDPRPRKGEAGIMKGGSVRDSRLETRISHRDTYNDNSPQSWIGVRCVSSPVDHVLPDGGVNWAE